jgi:protein-L-isoaspartate O-methyltransferase
VVTTCELRITRRLTNANSPRAPPEPSARGPQAPDRLLTKTISQPFIRAVMTDLLVPERQDKSGDRNGLGYQAAVLAESAGRILMEH